MGWCCGFMGWCEAAKGLEVVRSSGGMFTFKNKSCGVGYWLSVLLIY